MRRILILGFEPIGRKEGLKQLVIPGRFELWTFNNDHNLMKGSKRHFEMHELSAYGPNAVDDAPNDDKYLQKLRKGIGVPVYHLRETADIIGSVAYPIDEITAMFGDYITNSISYMLALAIYEKVDEIHLYGIDMARDHEHSWERPSIEYFLGWARGAGIKVVIPESSDLLKCMGLYGYGEYSPYEIQAKLRERIDRAESLATHYQRRADLLQGAADDTAYWLRRAVFDGDSAFKAKANGRDGWLKQSRSAYASSAREADAYVVKLKDAQHK